MQIGYILQRRRPVDALEEQHRDGVEHQSVLRSQFLRRVGAGIVPRRPIRPAVVFVRDRGFIVAEGGDEGAGLFGADANALIRERLTLGIGRLSHGNPSESGD